MSTDTALPAVPKADLGRSGVVSTSLGLGLAEWPRQVEEATFLAVMQAAFDAGLRHIDTSPLYGTEDHLGLALRELDVPDDLVIATKAGANTDFELGFRYYNFSGRAIRRSVERSLKRFGRDAIDVVFLHDVSAKTRDEAFGDRGGMAALAELRDEGLIRAAGVACRDLDVLQEAVESGVFDVIQMFHTYTLMNTTAADEVLPLARERGVGICNSAPFGGYILATGPVEGAKYGYFPAPPEVLEAAGRLEAYCAERGVALPDAALAFSLRSPLVDVTVMSTRRPERVADWVRSLALPLSEEDYAQMLQIAGGPWALTRGRRKQ